MANSNLPGYMEIKVEKYDNDTGTGELNLSYDEIAKYFLEADGQVFIKMWPEAPALAGAAIALVGAEFNVLSFDSPNGLVNIYMTGGSSKAFSLTEPTP